MLRVALYNNATETAALERIPSHGKAPPRKYDSALMTRNKPKRERSGTSDSSSANNAPTQRARMMGRQTSLNMVESRNARLKNTEPATNRHVLWISASLTL